MSFKSVLLHLNPAVDKRWLFLLAGILWASVGGFLCFRAYSWLKGNDTIQLLLFSGAGITLAIVWYQFMFVGIARKNVDRILKLPARVCIFAFAGWKGYGIIFVMIMLGMALRASSIPKQYLAPMYIAMGGALLLSSLLFYKAFGDSASSIEK